ncbi:hypothetical protein HDU93_001320 [Gonapodya sp. JEL0774]|nr:hypothetical protein HDU93_001320 [Gonapodya sp. JEL0774]
MHKRVSEEDEGGSRDVEAACPPDALSAVSRSPSRSQSSSPISNTYSMRNRSTSQTAAPSPTFVPPPLTNSSAVSPPLFSDGDPINHPSTEQSSGFFLAQGSRSESHWLPLCGLTAWPRGYALFGHSRARNERRRTDFYLFGMAGRRRFRSPNEFAPHLKWLKSVDEAIRKSTKENGATPSLTRPLDVVLDNLTFGSPSLRTGQPALAVLPPNVVVPACLCQYCGGVPRGARNPSNRAPGALPPRRSMKVHSSLSKPPNSSPSPAQSSDRRTSRLNRSSFSGEDESDSADNGNFSKRRRLNPPGSSYSGIRVSSWPASSSVLPPSSLSHKRSHKRGATLVEVVAPNAGEPIKWEWHLGYRSGDIAWAVVLENKEEKENDQDVREVMWPVLVVRPLPDDNVKQNTRKPHTIKDGSQHWIMEHDLEPHLNISTSPPPNPVAVAPCPPLSNRQNSSFAFAGNTMSEDRLYDVGEDLSSIDDERGCSPSSQLLKSQLKVEVILPSSRDDLFPLQHAASNFFPQQPELDLKEDFAMDLGVVTSYLPLVTSASEARNFISRPQYSPVDDIGNRQVLSPALKPARGHSEADGVSYLSPDTRPRDSTMAASPTLNPLDAPRYRDLFTPTLSEGISDVALNSRESGDSCLPGRSADAVSNTDSEEHALVLVSSLNEVGRPDLETMGTFRRPTAAVPSARSARYILERWGVHEGANRDRPLAYEVRRLPVSSLDVDAPGQTEIVSAEHIVPIELWRSGNVGRCTLWNRGAAQLMGVSGTLSLKVDSSNKSSILALRFGVDIICVGDLVKIVSNEVGAERLESAGNLRASSINGFRRVSRSAEFLCVGQIIRKPGQFVLPKKRWDDVDEISPVIGLQRERPFVVDRQFVEDRRYVEDIVLKGDVFWQTEPGAGRQFVDRTKVQESRDPRFRSLLVPSASRQPQKNPGDVRWIRTGENREISVWSEVAGRAHSEWPDKNSSRKPRWSITSISPWGVDEKRFGACSNLGETMRLYRECGGDRSSGYDCR